MPFTQPGQQKLNTLSPDRVPPIVGVYPTDNGYGVFKCLYLVKEFTGPSSRAEAWEYAERLLDDLRYEVECS